MLSSIFEGMALKKEIRANWTGVQVGSPPSKKYVDARLSESRGDIARISVIAIILPPANVMRLLALVRGGHGHWK